MGEPDFVPAFAGLAVQLLDVARTYVDEAESVNRIVLGIMQRDGMSVAIPVYEVAGERRRCHELSDIGIDCSQSAQVQLLMDLGDLTDDFVDSVSTSAEFPSLCVVDYDVPNDQMRAEFYYDDLQPGVAEADRIPFDNILREWVERFVITGDLSFMAHYPDTWQQWRADQ